MFGKKLKKTITIEGMSCEHCAKKVETTLLSVEGIKKVKVNLKEKTAMILLNETIENDVIRKTIENLDYKVLEVKDL